MSTHNPNASVYAIGLTGGISSGKTVAGEYLCKYFKVLDADALVHELYDTDPILVERIAEEFGDICVERGKVDRKILGSLVFKNPQALNQLNAIVHPLVGKSLSAEISKAHSERVVTVFLIPLLFEHNWQEDLDTVLLVGCSEQTQLERILLRDHRSIDEARAIVAAQMPLEEKRLLCDSFLSNDADLEGFYEKLDAWVQGLLRDGLGKRV
jgi:dephospho-CoA kinase